MACDPLIDDPFEFPLRPSNRPGLPRIAYRVGRYEDFVEALLRRIDAAPALAAWTHREADDPGIALLQGAAILGDILSFYQEHYANEAFLRTAAWRESVAELVRLTGYRLAPGLGGRATLALEARGTEPVTIRQGFPVKLELADIPLPADFQTVAEIEAWPQLGRFNLYRARRYAAILPAGASTLELASVDGASDSLSLAAFELKPADRLLLLPAEPPWTGADVALSEQPAPQIVKVTKVTRLLGRVLIDLEGKLDRDWNLPVAAYRLGRSFKHFGHNAPPQTVSVNNGASGLVTTVSATRFERRIDASPDTGDTSAAFPLTPGLVPLDLEVNDLVVGARVIVQAKIFPVIRFIPLFINGSFSSLASFAGFPLSVVRTIKAISAGTLGFGNLNGPSTLITLDQPLIRQALPRISPLSDIRDWRIHEVTSPPLGLQPVSAPLGGAFSDGRQALNYYGTAAQARRLAGRRLYLFHTDGRSAELVCTNTTDDFPTPGKDAPQPWALSFDRAPAPFTQADFDEAAPTVTVFGNLVDATQGKAERAVALGNGDSRQSFQTFPLPKAPLTYFLSAGAIPPQVPELQIWVNNRLWQRVDSFFGHGAREQIYIVREDAEGRSFVQFGDGETGGRLPSGFKNVSVVYRTGVGARGAGKPGAAPTASERPPGFDKVSLAGIVSGGADPEPMDKAREAAPGKVQSLGRLVSLRDYETETLAIPGVVTATAAWALHGGVPAVVLAVLLEAGREAEFGEVRLALARAQRCRGPDRFALVVEQAVPRYVYLNLVYARDPSYRREDVEAGLRAALGLAGDPEHERGGLFGLRARRLGEAEYASRIEGRLQNVAGVLWCKIAAMGFAKTIAPLPFGRGVGERVENILPCNAHELLQLAPEDLTLTAAAEASAPECA